MMQFLEAGISSETILSGWVGPDDALQDFLLGSGAVGGEGNDVFIRFSCEDRFAGAAG
jgi:hypothetical protein